MSLECRITLNGKERWVRNVIIRGEIEDSEYAMIFLRDITEAKIESCLLYTSNDKMLDNGQISEKLHSSIQKDIITLSTFNTVVAKNGEQMDSSGEYLSLIHISSVD